MNSVLHHSRVPLSPRRPAHTTTKDGEISSTDQYGHETLTTYDQDGRVVEPHTRSRLIKTEIWSGWPHRRSTTPRGKSSCKPISTRKARHSPLTPPRRFTTRWAGRSRRYACKECRFALLDPNNGQTVNPTTDPGNIPVVSEVTNWGTELYSTQTVYNSFGQVAESIAADGEVTQYQYNSLGQQIATIGQPVPASTVGLRKRAGGRVNDGQPPRGNRVRRLWQHGLASHEHLPVRPSGRYDPARLLECADRRSTSTTNSATFWKRFIPTARPRAPPRAATASHISTTDQMGQTTEYHYDNENRIIGVTLPAVANPATGHATNPTYEYGYDANGNQTSLTDPNGGVTTFTYDAQGSATVHAPGSSDGAGWWAKWAWTASATKAKTLRDCWRQVSTTVSIVSTKRLPRALCVPNDNFRQITACRKARSLALLVGSTPSTSQEGPQPLAMVVQFAAHAHQPRIAAEDSAQQQAFHLPADRLHQPLQSGPGERPVAVARPQAEQFPRQPHQVASQPFGLMVAGDRSGLGSRVSSGPSTIASVGNDQYILARSQ